MLVEVAPRMSDAYGMTRVVEKTVSLYGSGHDVRKSTGCSRRESCADATSQLTEVQGARVVVLGLVS